MIPFLVSRFQAVNHQQHFDTFLYDKANDEEKKVEDLFEKLSGNPSKQLLALSREPAVPPGVNIAKSPISLKPVNKLPIASMPSTIIM